MVLFLAVPTSTQARQQFFKLPIPAWFSQATEPIQSAIKSITTKTDNHEIRIAELEKKVVDLELKISSLEIQLTNHTNMLINPNSSGITINPSEPVGIGPTNPTEKLNLDCGSSDCQDLLKLNE